MEVAHFQYPVKHGVTTTCYTNCHHLIRHLKLKSGNLAWNVEIQDSSTILVFNSAKLRSTFLCCIHYLHCQWMLDCWMSLLMKSVQNSLLTVSGKADDIFSSDYKEMKQKPTSILITFLSFHINCSSLFLICDFTVVSITIVTLLFSILHNAVINRIKYRKKKEVIDVSM